MLVCVRPVRKLHCWFSHDAAHLFCKVTITFGSSFDSSMSTLIIMPPYFRFRMSLLNAHPPVACQIVYWPIQSNQSAACQPIKIFSCVKRYIRAGIVHRIEPRREKTGLRGFRPGPTQTGLYSHRSRLEDLSRRGIVLSE